MTRGEVAVKNIRDCRAMSSLFRQFAVFDPAHCSKHLIEAQRWEHLAEAEITSHFKHHRICHRRSGVTGPLINQKEPPPKAPDPIARAGCAPPPRVTHSIS